MPVPSVTPSIEVAPRPAPRPCSASANARASLMSRVGIFAARATSAVTGMPSQRPGMFGMNLVTPAAGSSTPGMPTPIEVMPLSSPATPVATPIICRMTLCSPSLVSVCTRPVLTRRGSAPRSTTAHFRFVPPRSRPRWSDTPPIVPPMPEVMTVLGPIPAAELGVTDAHDHLFLRSPALAGQDFDDVDKAVEEVASSDLETIVEVTPIGLGRNPAGMREVSERTGVHIVAATGYHRDAHYPPGHWVHSATLEQLAERIVADLRQGMDGEAARAGVVKAGASYQRITPSEERRLIAAA